MKTKIHSFIVAIIVSECKNELVFIFDNVMFVRVILSSYQKYAI